MKDILFPGRKADDADGSDGQIMEDLRDSLAAHRDGCVGMAVNMRGWQ